MNLLYKIIVFKREGSKLYNIKDRFGIIKSMCVLIYPSVRQKAIDTISQWLLLRS